MPNNIIMADKATGEWTTEGILNGTEPSGDIVTTKTNIRDYALAGTAITSFRAPNATKIVSGSFRECKAMTNLFLPALTVASGYFAYGCDHLLTAVVHTTSMANNRVFENAFQNCTRLEKVDLGGTTLKSFNSNVFYGCAALDFIIIRATTIPSTTTNNFTGTPFDSGGTGGTIYIPKTLFDHLGDGTSLDYKAANGWSTLDGYGTITWAQIEGSIYETQYADGTPISAGG